MKQKTRNRILIGLFGVVGILFTSSTVFGGSNNGGNGGELTNGLINNSVCIDYVTPSGLTGHTCSSVSVTYTGSQNTGGNEYVIKKSQKTGGMADYTQREINVESGEYILYKVEFASVTGSCTSATVQDTLPRCVEYIDSSITGVIGIPTFNSGLHYIEYKRFGLNGRNTGYLFITGQIIANTSDCSGSEYINTGSFKCNTPSGRLISSSVVARRIQGGGTSGSLVIFEKTGNRYERHPGETGLKFTIRVENEGPNDISDVYVYDIWPGNNNCIEFDRWVGNQSAIEYLGDYKRHYKRGNGILRAGWHFEFDIYANISNNQSCTGSYINTGQLTYVESGKPHEKIDDYQFIAVDGGGGSIKMSIKKTVEPTVVTSGSEVTYTIKYTNEGDTTLTDYTIKDNRPYQYLDFVSATPNINSSGSNRSTLSWWTPNLPSLEAGDSREITVIGRVKAR